MSLRKVEKSLKELHKKLEEERMLRELPGLVAGIEDAMCEQDMATGAAGDYRGLAVRAGRRYQQQVRR